MRRFVRCASTLVAVATLVGATVRDAGAQWLLVPMDRSQQNHLRAYGLTYWALEQGQKAEWLLNYRDGSFLLPDQPEIRREAALRGVTVSSMDAGGEARMRATIVDSNMEAVPLERAPKVAVYKPPNTTPWDDAVTMVLEYAGIAYETIWDPEVLDGDLSQYEWIHLHHEDFTGQYSKFYLTYAGAPWLQEEIARNQEVARAHGLANVAALKKAGPVDIAAAYSDGTPPDPDASAKMNWGHAMAFTGAQVQVSPSVNAFSDIDGHQVNTPWREELGVYTLFDFSAKFDPVPSMLTQDHESVLPDFYGLTTTFRKDRLQPGDIVLAEEGGWAKYVHGTLGEGTGTFFGGHDPEDPEHQIGDPPTDLALHPNSPGYRLILNNVLFPAAKKKKLKT